MALSLKIDCSLFAAVAWMSQMGIGGSVLGPLKIWGSARNGIESTEYAEIPENCS